MKIILLLYFLSLSKLLLIKKKQNNKDISIYNIDDQTNTSQNVSTESFNPYMTEIKGERLNKLLDDSIKSTSIVYSYNILAILNDSTNKNNYKQSNMKFFNIAANGQKTEVTDKIKVDKENSCTLIGDNAYHGVTPCDLKKKLSTKTFSMIIVFHFKKKGVVLSELGQIDVESGWHESFIEISDKGTNKNKLYLSFWNIKTGLNTFETNQEINENDLCYIAIRYDESTNNLDGFYNGTFFQGINKKVLKNEPKDTGYTSKQYFAITPSKETTRVDKTSNSIAEICLKKFEI